MSKKNRFVIVQNSLRTVYKFRLSYLKKLLSKGDVYIIAPNDDAFSFNELKKTGVYIYNIPAGHGFIGKTLEIFKMNLFIIKERFFGSTFVCHFLITFILTYITIAPFNAKLVIYIEGLGTIFSNHKTLQKILKFFLIKNSAVRFFCNASERFLIGRSSDFVINGIGIDLSKFSCSSHVLRNGEKYRLLYVGRLIKDKGVIDAIEVLRYLLSKGIDVSLSLVGEVYNGNPSSLSKEDICLYKNEFGDFIEFAGYTHDIKRFYIESDILLIPSIREGFPVCVMEASAMGIPSVGYDVPGVRDAITNGINGIVVPFRDVKRLSCAVEGLLSNGALLDYYSKCKKIASDNFCSNHKDWILVDKLCELSKSND
ncbi:glycosyltransferase [Edwardsiella tarda]|uniref:glycosyltransferase n=1 Tax=Edwardsiella tarda TaxID=636 RepID=UPI00351CB230